MTRQDTPLHSTSCKDGGLCNCRQDQAVIKEMRRMFESWKLHGSEKRHPWFRAFVRFGFIKGE